MQTGTLFITNGAILALLRLQKRITPCGRVLYVTATYPDNLVTKTYIKYRKELGANWAIRQANNDREKHLIIDMVFPVAQPMGETVLD